MLYLGTCYPFGAAQYPAWAVMPGIPWIVTGMLLCYLFLRRGERLAGTPHGSKDLSPKGHCLVLGELESPSASARPTQHLHCSTELSGQEAVVTRLEDWCLEMRAPRGGESTQRPRCPDTAP